MTRINRCDTKVEVITVAAMCEYSLNDTDNRRHPLANSREMESDVALGATSRILWQCSPELADCFRTMFSILPLAPRGRESFYGGVRHHPSVQNDVDMDLDEDVLDHGSRIISPGEMISSSSAVLRFVSLPDRMLHIMSESHLLEDMEHTLRMRR
jgi:hypothetical protein